MPLQPGTTLGPYEIQSPLGAGGMGEVYKATDTRLDRTVAIKVLLAHVADDPDLRQRFEREAKTISSLNHPHICTLHDIGQQDGVDYLVMEYLEGETLAARLTKGPLPTDQVLRYATEIADALDKAHRKGITHRDLKPGNIMITKAGTKLLDFGLAKLRDPKTAGLSLSQRPTATASLTGEGKILGTLQYMAPEQLEGKDADARTDIFAFGAVIYEIATGRKAFEGDSQASLIGAILKDEPAPMSTLQPMTPPALDRLVRACLAKHPDDRWQAAHDLERELRWITEGRSQGSRETVPPGRTRKRLAWVAAIALVAVATGVAVGMFFPSTAKVSQSVTRTLVVLPAGQALDVREGVAQLAVSPDGRQLVYGAESEGRTQLYLRSLDAYEATAIAGTDGAQFPFFSPDGQWIAYFASGMLQRVSVEGGAPLMICEARDPTLRGGSWGPDGTIVFSGSSGLRRVAAGGGVPEPVTGPDGAADTRTYFTPRFLPDNRGLVAGVPGQGVAVHSWETGQWRVLGLQGLGSQAQYLPSGHLVYYSGGGQVHAVSFDLDELAVDGTPFSAIDGVLQAPGGDAFFAVADAGTMVYAPAGLARRLVRVDREGRRTPLSADRRGFRLPRVSPDGRQVAVTIDPRPSEVWVYDADRGTGTPLAATGHNMSPLWTKDGRRVVYFSSQDLYSRAADGSSEAELLLGDNRAGHPESWTPDGQSLLFFDRGAATGWDLNLLAPDGTAEVLLSTTANELSPQLSPDGRWLAYFSDESGQDEVYVRPFPNVQDRRWTVSTAGGWSPVWSPDSRELFYMNGAAVMAVRIDAQGDAFVHGTPELLFEGPFDTIMDRNFDVSPNGTHFVMVEADPNAGADRFHVVQNWFEELKAPVPTDR